TLIWFFIMLIALFTLAYHQVNKLIWTIVVGALLFLYLPFSGFHVISSVAIMIFFLVFALILNADGMRRRFITSHFFKLYKRYLPLISQTEQEAIDAGTVDWDGDLVKG